MRGRQCRLLCPGLYLLFALFSLGLRYASWSRSACVYCVCVCVLVVTFDSRLVCDVKRGGNEVTKVDPAKFTQLL